MYDLFVNHVLKGERKAKMHQPYSLKVFNGVIETKVQIAMTLTRFFCLFFLGIY